MKEQTPSQEPVQRLPGGTAQVLVTESSETVFFLVGMKRYLVMALAFIAQYHFVNPPFSSKPPGTAFHLCQPGTLADGIFHAERGPELALPPTGLHGARARGAWLQCGRWAEGQSLGQGAPHSACLGRDQGPPSLLPPPTPICYHVLHSVILHLLLPGDCSCFLPPAPPPLALPSPHESQSHLLKT